MKRPDRASFDFRMSAVERGIVIFGVVGVIAVELSLFFSQPAVDDYWLSLAGVTILLSFPLLRSCVTRRLDPFETGKTFRLFSIP